MEISFTGAVMELLLWLWGYLFGKRKNIIGKHYEDTVEIVPIDWHPAPEQLRYKGLWHQRFSKHAHAAFLRIPARAFRWWIAIEDEIALTVRLSNYKWAEVPINMWPKGWR